MKPTIIVTLTARLEIEPEVQYYNPGASIRDIAEVEEKNALNDPHLFLDHAGVELKVETRINYPVRCAICREQFLMHSPHVCEPSAPEPDDLEEHNRNEAADYADE